MLFFGHFFAKYRTKSDHLLMGPRNPFCHCTSTFSGDFSRGAPVQRCFFSFCLGDSGVC